MVCVCVNCCEKRHLCYEIYTCALGITSLFLEGRSYGVFQTLMRGILRALT